MITANGGTKVPTKFFLPNRLMPFFTANPESDWESTVVGKRIDADAAMRDGRGKRHHVEDSAAADDHDERLPVESDIVDALEHLERMGEIVLHRLPALDDHRSCHQVQGVGKRGEVSANVLGKRGVRRRDLIIDDHQHTVAAVDLLAADDVEKDGVGPTPGVLRKVHRKPEGHREPVGLLHGHESVQQIGIQYSRGGNWIHVDHVSICV